MKKRAPIGVRKHLHGTPNPIFQSEEESMLAAVDKALASSTNAQIVGANGEIPLREFFNRYLPVGMRAGSGHFITPSGKVSPQIDILIIDSRYPLLAENRDGSVLVMMHSVITIIECKTNITTKDIKKLWKDASTIKALVDEVKEFAGDEFGGPIHCCLAYRHKQRLDTLLDRFFGLGTPNDGHVDLILLRVSDEDKHRPEPLGGLLHFEPVSMKDIRPIEWVETFIYEFTPLSDLYYRTVQDAYYTLGARNYSFNDIGSHVMEYLSWSTVRD